MMTTGQGADVADEGAAIGRHRDLSDGHTRISSERPASLCLLVASLAGSLKPLYQALLGLVSPSPQT